MHLVPPPLGSINVLLNIGPFYHGVTTRTLKELPS